jgi:Glycosyl transferase family 2
VRDHPIEKAMNVTESVDTQPADTGLETTVPAATGTNVTAPVVTVPEATGPAPTASEVAGSTASSWSTASDSSLLRVRIAVLTYRRPRDIADALPRLLTQAESVRTSSVSTDIVVVDNDPSGGARSYVESFAAQNTAVPVIYENETTPGIAAARNRALETAADVDLLVFIDDDERPTERWLALLLDTYLASRPAAVVGPVISEYEIEPDAWVRSGRFFDRRRLPSGSRVNVAATNNLLLDLHQVRSFGLGFDDQFGITGGSDTMFTRTLHRLGGQLIWCDEAIVIDVVPASRVTREWVLRRAFRSGSSWSATSLKLAHSRRGRMATRLRLTGRGSVRVAGGAARVAVGALGRSQGQRARGQRTIARGAGMLSGAWGYIYSEYKRS